MDEIKLDRRASNSRPAFTIRSSVAGGSSESLSASPVADAEGARETAKSLVHVETMDFHFEQLARLCEA